MKYPVRLIGLSFVVNAVLLLASAVPAFAQLSANGQAKVYLDGGHARWQSASTMASRVLAAGIASAAGFTLNVSNFITDADNVTYGAQVSTLTGGKHFIIDTSRNGNGSANGAWCNPQGSALGAAPTAKTGHPLVDAFLWIKRPGESDGKCNGGPNAGRFWGEYALNLAKRQPASLAMHN